jgi:hypothetical protein
MDSTGLCAIGTAALIWTLILSRRSTKEAANTANAARDAVGSERAWITFESVTHQMHKFPTWQECNLQGNAFIPI